MTATTSCASPPSAALPADDLVLTQRAATGDPRACAALVQRTIQTVRRVTRSLAANRADADDAAQSALIEILRSAHTFRGDSPLLPWARRITIRATFRHLRRERKWASAGAGDEANQVYAVASEPASTGHDVESFLQQVSAAQRRAIVLHHGLGYSLDECAALEHCSPNTIKGRLRLGLTTLRRLMRREDNLETLRPAREAWPTWCPALAVA